MTNNKVEYKIASSNNIKEVQNLLKENQLPFEDIESSDVSLIIAAVNGQIIGCIGIEIKCDDALLRSFSVADKYKKQGIGNELFNRLLNNIQSRNIKTLHLLTITAKEYFDKKGFVISKRNDAPNLIKATSEFSSLCPSNSVYMKFDLIKNNSSED